MGIIPGSIPRGAGVERGPGVTYYADANNGSDAKAGRSWQEAKLTIAAAVALMGEGDTLYLSGKFREEAVTPPSTAGGISIIGADDRLPAHADAPWASGASWLPPASPTAATPLVKVRAQGVTFENILFDCPVDAGAVALERNALSGDSEFDGSHANFRNCRFTSGQSGISNAGGCGFVRVEKGCRFYDLTNAIKNLDTAVAIPLRWIVEDSIFMENTNHIVSSCTDWVIWRNVFMKHTTDSLDLIHVSGQGATNVVTQNLLSGTYSIAGGYTPSATDEWGGNFNSITGGVTAANPA